MSGWRDELVQAIKTADERQTEEAERKRKRLEEALQVAETALTQAGDGLRFAGEQLEAKRQPATFSEGDGRITLTLRELSVAVELNRQEAIVTVIFNQQRPREFDFSKDRHLSPKDVEEYVGRRAVELARAAQKTDPW
jgi:hypothetical protein